MLIIDPSGMFLGDRMWDLTDKARLYWAWFYLASNGCGRLEINYRRLLAQVFVGFKIPPSEEEVLACVNEYHEKHLLFLYEVGGQLWGQWDTSEKFKPKYKTANDLRSPAPPSDEFSKWKDQYIEFRVQKRATLALSTIPKTSQNVSEDFGKFSSVVAVVDVGVGAEKACPPDGGRPTERASKPRKSAASLELEQRQAAWFEVWWSHYWRHVSKKPAFEAFKRACTTPERFEQILAATKAQKPAMLARDPEHRPHGATWLNAERWTDEESTPAKTATSEVDYPMFRDGDGVLQ